VIAARFSDPARPQSHAMAFKHLLWLCPNPYQLFLLRIQCYPLRQPSQPHPPTQPPTHPPTTTQPTNLLPTPSRRPSSKSSSRCSPQTAPTPPAPAAPPPPAPSPPPPSGPPFASRRQRSQQPPCGPRAVRAAGQKPPRQRQRRPPLRRSPRQRRLRALPRRRRGRSWRSCTGVLGRRMWRAGCWRATCCDARVRVHRLPLGLRQEGGGVFSLLVCFLPCVLRIHCRRFPDA